MKPPDITVERRADGCTLITSNHPSGVGPRSIAHLLADRSAAHPDRPYMKQREPGHGPWRTITYGQALRAAEGIAQALIGRGLGANDAVLILSANSIEHAVLALGCTTAGVPFAAISPAYSLAAGDHERLRHCFRTVRPAIVFAQSRDAFARAFETLRRLDDEVILLTADADGVDTELLTDWAATFPTPAVARARDALDHASIAKYLFTSGSTGAPKAAAQTHGMMHAVIAGLEGLRADARAGEPEFVPQTLEWMPWSHLAAGNIGFNGVLWSGGTIFLDEGKPVPGLFETTIKNLYEVSPVVFASAPIAFAMLADAMERDPTLRHSFFRNLQNIAYGGATLSNDLYNRLQALSIAETGMRIALTTMYGATETQGVTVTHWITERAGLVGLPMPGITLKLVPDGSKLEARVRGPSVTPFYLRDPEKTRAAFDEEGFYRLGDAVRFIDENDPAQGLLFDGRIGEDFKLASGTWVSVGVLRPELIAACSPYVQDAVIVGQDQAFIGALLWPSNSASVRFATPAGGLDLSALCRAVADVLAAYNNTATGSSQRVRRFIMMTQPPSLDRGEITDKGYVNQRAVLEHRASLASAIHEEPPGSAVCLV